MADGNFGGGDGTSGNRHILEDYADIEAMVSGGFYRFGNDINCGGSTLTRRTGVDFHIDMAGFTLSNFAIQFGFWLRDIGNGTLGGGGIEGGTIGCSLNSGGLQSLFRTDRGYVRNMSFTGSITSTDNNASIINETASDCDISDIISSVDITSGGTGAASFFVNNNTLLDATRVVNVGVMVAGGTGTAYGLSNVNSNSFVDCFWDETINSTISSGGDTANDGRTTTQLQTLTTYTNESYDMVAIGSYVDEVWAIDDGNAYPVLGWSVEPAPSATIVQPVTITINSSS